MANRRHLVGGIALLALTSGCAIEEIRSKNKFGAEWRHSGSRSTAEERYSVEPGFEFKWDKGISTGLSYRRRDIDNGSGDSDNGLFVDVSFPLWKRPKAEAKSAQIEALEQRIAELEAAQARYLSRSPDEPGPPVGEKSEPRVAQVTGGRGPTDHNQNRN